MNNLIDAIHTPIAFWAMGAPFIIPKRYYPLVLLTYIFILGNWSDSTPECHLTRLSDRFYKTKKMKNVIFHIKEKKTNTKEIEQEKFIKRLLNEYIGLKLTDYQVNEATFWITFINAL